MAWSAARFGRISSRSTACYQWQRSNMYRGAVLFGVDAFFRRENLLHFVFCRWKTDRYSPAVRSGASHLRDRFRCHYYSRGFSKVGRCVHSTGGTDPSTKNGPEYVRTDSIGRIHLCHRQSFSLVATLENGGECLFSLPSLSTITLSLSIRSPLENRPLTAKPI